MFFSDLLASDADRESWRKNCQALSIFVSDCVACMVKAFDCAQEAASKSGQNHHIVPLLLTRHVIESLDGISVLIAEGCSHSCQAPLRSTLEATLGVLYILQTDTERRAFS